MRTEAFHSLILAEVIGCPIPMVDGAVMASADEFCRETLSWRELQDPAPLTNGLDEYDVEVPVGAYVASVLKVFVNGDELKPVADDFVSPASASLPSMYNANADFSVVKVYPTPLNPSGYLQIKVAFAPLQTATILPDFLARHLDTIAAGAKSRLMMQPNMSWTNPSLAAFYKQQFDAAVTKSRIADSHGRVSSSLYVRPMRFI